ncbi:hypothetical protein N431DRAFT_420775 [Stipitochalara longipes BDJ]|nr:hypothetical protein N431DRAFT_420775 [Stipitochalara longipes BDJ]
MNPLNEGACMTLGTSMLNRWLATGDKKDLHLAVDRFEACFRNPKFSNFVRVKGAASAGLWAMDLEEYNRASDLFEDSVSLLPNIYQHLVDLRDWQYVLSSLTGLAELIASARLLHNSQSVWEALHRMEYARGLIASVTINARNDNRIVVQPSIRGGINNQYNEQLFMNLADNGPIITFVVSQHKSSAIIITSEGVRSIDLPNLKWKDLQQDAIEYVVGENATTKGTESTRFVRNKRFQKLLVWLWNVAVKPVLENLGFYRDSVAQSKLPRLWWISSGLMGAMPLHAAGTHSHGSRENTISHVVSSYAPTIQSLRYSRQRLIEIRKGKDPSVMVAAMPKTEKKKELKVEDEISMLETAFSKITVLRSPTEDVALESMRTHNIGHFICHGFSHPYDPSQSGLVLSSGTLTLETLLKHYFPEAHIMYMSACSTAETSNTKLVDEVLHVGSGFQLVGFPHVIATLWEVENKEATKVAKKFYSGIKANGRGYLEEGVVARALHEAVRQQRDAQEDDDLFAWAAQVHFGP